MTRFGAALAELSAAATAYLRAEPDGLSRLVAARDRADALLHRERAALECDCRAASGFHSPACALFQDSRSRQEANRG